MKIGNMRDMSLGELKKFIDEMKSKAVKLRFDLATRKTTSHREYRNTRKDIARALTVENEKNKQSSSEVNE